MALHYNTPKQTRLLPPSPHQSRPSVDMTGTATVGKEEGLLSWGPSHHFLHPLRLKRFPHAPALAFWYSPSPIKGPPWVQLSSTQQGCTKTTSKQLLVVHLRRAFVVVSPLMAQELERPHVTEMHVRMDCNGCVHRIKRALHGVQGIYDVQIDFAQQKLTVVGTATPEKIVRAIKKTRKIATVCSHKEAGAPEAPPQEPAPAAADQPPAETPPADAAPPAEQTKEAPAPEEVTGEVKPPPEAAGATAASQPEAPPTEGKDVGEVHMVYHYPPHHHQVYRQHWGDYPGYGYPVQYEATYNTVIQSYSRYTPSSTISEYGDLRPPPESIGYTAEEAYGDGYYYGSGSSGRSNITSMFSDENPNACRIV